jgi:hypothetical protein
VKVYITKERRGFSMIVNQNNSRPQSQELVVTDTFVESKQSFLCEPNPTALHM